MLERLKLLCSRVKARAVVLASRCSAKVVGLVSGVSAVSLASKAFATDPPPDADLATIFSAINLAGIKTNVATLLVVGITMTAMFVGYALYKRGVNKVK